MYATGYLSFSEPLVAEHTKNVDKQTNKNTFSREGDAFVAPFLTTSDSFDLVNVSVSQITYTEGQHHSDLPTIQRLTDIIMERNDAQTPPFLPHYAVVVLWQTRIAPNNETRRMTVCIPSYSCVK